MPLTVDQALKKAKDLLKESAPVRAAQEALYGLWLCYTYGNQWAGMSRGPRGGLRPQGLPPIMDPSRGDVRFAMNLIRPRVAKLHSRLKPAALAANVEPASRAMNDQIAAMVGGGLLDNHLADSGALRKLRQASLWRVVMGSVIVARYMAARGAGVIVRDEEGTPRLDSAGQPLTLRSYDHDWAVCPPHDFIRDPAANAVTFDGEEAIGREKPRPTTWVARTFGIPIKKLETSATMGKLLEFQRFLYNATGQTFDSGWGMSETPAVMVSEWVFRDDESDARRTWPWYLLAYRDTGGEEAEARALKQLYFGPNPFHGLPYHHLWYDTQLLSPWGRGVPSLCMSAQDAINLAFTAFLRAFLRQSGNKLLVEQNSVISGLNQDQADPIVYRPGSKPPDRLAAPPVDPGVAAILGRAPEWLDWMLNMSPAQMGEPVKRGQSARAYQVLREAADTPLVGIIDDDELTINELLTGTLFDIVSTASVEELQEALSREFTPEQIITLKRQDMARAVVGVRVRPDSLRRKTPEELHEEYALAINSQMIDPLSARRALLVKGGAGLNVREAEAYRQQTQELQDLLAGREVEVYLEQDHDTHQFRVAMEQESRRWYGYSPQQREAVQSHARQHEEAKAIKARLAQANEMVGAAPASAEAAPQVAPPQPGQPAGAGGEGSLYATAPPGIAEPGVMAEMAGSYGPAV